MIPASNLEDHPLLQLINTLSIISLYMSRFEELIGEEYRAVPLVSDEAQHSSVVSETVLLDMVDHCLGEDDAGDLLQLQDLHVLVDHVSEGDDVVRDVARESVLHLGIIIVIISLVRTVFITELTPAGNILSQIILPHNSKHSASRLQLNLLTHRLQHDDDDLCYLFTILSLL